MTFGEKLQRLRRREGRLAGAVGRFAGGLPAGGVPLGAGRVPAGDRQPASPGGSSWACPSTSCWTQPEGWRAPSPRKNPPLRRRPPPPRLPEGTPQTAALAVSPADGAGGFCRLGPVAAGQCPLPGTDPPDQGLWLCFLLYLLLLVIYFLVWGIRYFKQRTRPPQ